MAGVLPTPARDTGIGDLRLFAPPLNTSYVACRVPLFNAVVGMTHSIAEASQSRIVSPRTRDCRSVEPCAWRKLSGCALGKTARALLSPVHLPCECARVALVAIVIAGRRYTYTVCTFFGRN